nr:hypothetical protein [Fibrobacterota bacterium]
MKSFPSHQASSQSIVPTAFARLFASILGIVLMTAGLSMGKGKDKVEAVDAGGKTETRLRFYQERLAKYLTTLKKADTLKPYFLAYRINDTLFLSFLANKGGVIEDKSGASRYLG